MSLESLAADLEKNGIGFRIVTAQTTVAAIPPLSKWDHNKSKEFSDVERYILYGEPASYEITKTFFGDDSTGTFKWALIKKSIEANKSKTAIAPVTSIYTTSGWKLFPFYRRQGKQFSTPEDARDFLAKLR